MAALHLYAYNTAAGSSTPATRVLDVGFGEGYGSEALLEAEPNIGESRSMPDIVEHARERYGPHFETYDGTTGRCARRVIRPRRHRSR